MTTKPTKTYSVNVSVSIHDKATSYPEVKPIDFTVRENLPANVDPEKYLRQRIAEELKRHFSALSTLIENKTEDAEEEDPLAA